METSNIIGESNIYPCKGNPLCDQEFVNQIEDYNLIKAICKMQNFRQSSIQLTEKQTQLLEIEMRCVYAKTDPCWGYINGLGIQSRCIEGRCPQINSCNPIYTSEQQAYWTMTDEAKARYGYPAKQKKYYLVDLVSNEEMSRYLSDPKGAGIEYPPMADSNPKESESEPKNLKERKLVVIGYEEIYFGDADNQLSPILGYVDDAEDLGSMVTRQYGSRKEVRYENACKIGEKDNRETVTQHKTLIKEKDSPKELNKSISATSMEHKLRYEKMVKDKIGNSYQLIEITEERIGELSCGKTLNIILSNEAEKAYVSSMLLQANISHDIELCNGKEGVCLWKAQSKSIEFSSEIILVSSAFIKQGCSFETEAVWAGLGDASGINEVVVSGREFFTFSGKDEQHRWGCRNLYGATHLAIQNDDMVLFSPIQEHQPVSLMKDNENYIVLSKNNAEQLGVTTEYLWKALERLERADEIPAFPRLIAGLVLAKTSDGFEIKGIGHMKFDEY